MKMDSLQQIPQKYKKLSGNTMKNYVNKLDNLEEMDKFLDTHTIKTQTGRNKKKTVEQINETKSWFFEKIKKTDKLLARHLKKESGPKQIKTQMKMNLLQPIPQKYKQLSENTMKSYMPTNWTT